MIPYSGELQAVSSKTYQYYVEQANVSLVLLAAALSGKSTAELHIEERFIDEILKDLESANYQIDDNPYAIGNLIVVTVRW